MRALSCELAEIRRIARHLGPARRAARLAAEMAALAVFVVGFSSVAVLTTSDAPAPGVVMIAEAGR